MMTSFQELITVSTAKRITLLTLNRIEKRNALSQTMIQAFVRALHQLAHDDDCRVLLIHGNGECFCAGADIKDMQKIAEESYDDNVNDAQSLASLLYQLYSFPKPTVVLAHHAVYGAGLGLLAVCDIAFAAQDTNFAFLEVKIGITPSIISPYIVAAIGERMARYYFLTGERFNAEEARRIGLIHHITAHEDLMKTGLAIANSLLANGPTALNTTKQLLKLVSKEKITETLSQKTAEHLAQVRGTSEAKEGFLAFTEKRSPNWK